jgi:anaerobic selenocysteine-containing dehydrogenase
MERTSYKTCPLCEATCGLEIVTRGREVVSIKGDEQDVFSRGYLCPKAYSLKELDSDPDRLRQPMIRRGDQWQTVGWDEAFAEIERGLMPVIQEHGRNSLGAYIGNPNAHNLSNLLYSQVVLKALGSPNIFSASTVDQMPKQISAGLMFGNLFNLPVPDLERTDYLLMLGANPLVSNGSLMTAPDMRGRLRRLRQRGGKLVVIDPQRTRTAEEADAHYFIRPGSDAHFLFALVQVLFAEGLVKPGQLAEHTNGLDQIEELAGAFRPENVSEICGIAPETIRQIARELAGAERAAVYARIGTCVHPYGTLASWLVDVLNVLTGNLDKPGGAMFANAAVQPGMATATPGKGRGVRFGRWHSRVRGLPEAFGELPAICLAEEIETPGPGQIRALVTIAGNPVLSNPNSARLQKALDSLDFMVSVDIYLNETTRHANVILPPPSALERSHYDLALYRLAVHNVANYSPPVFEKSPGQPDEWEILVRLAGLLSGQGANPDTTALDDTQMRQMIEREVNLPGSNIEGRDPSEIFEALQPRRGPERILDFLLRTGPYGDALRTKPDGLTLATLETNPHGVDLGPLQPRIPEVLRTPSGKIELAPPMLVEDVTRLRASLEQKPEVGQLLLIGRRDLRSNNSWMHNLNVLVKGKNRCTLRIHPEDAVRLGLKDGETARITSRVGSLEAPVEITEDIMPGVVSLPHGWGHNLPGARLQTAAEHAGVNSNLLADETAFDPISGNAVLNAIPVTLAKLAAVGEAVALTV